MDIETHLPKAKMTETDDVILQSNFVQSGKERSKGEKQFTCQFCELQGREARKHSDKQPNPGSSESVLWGVVTINLATETIKNPAA